MLHNRSVIGLFILVALLLSACQPIIAEPEAQPTNEACPDGLIAYWKFDEGEGDVACDAVGDNGGVIHNGAGWGSGMIGSALSFDGNNDRVRLPADVISGDTLTVNL